MSIHQNKCLNQQFIIFIFHNFRIQNRRSNQLIQVTLIMITNYATPFTFLKTLFWVLVFSSFQGLIHISRPGMQGSQRRHESKKINPTIEFKAYLIIFPCNDYVKKHIWSHIHHIKGMHPVKNLNQVFLLKKV